MDELGTYMIEVYLHKERISDEAMELHFFE